MEKENNTSDYQYPFVIVEADDDFNKALNNLCNSVQKFGFNVVHIHNMKDTLNRNCIDFNSDYCIVELCNPDKAFKALNLDLRLGNLMPKHIIVFKDIDLINKYMLMRPDTAKLQELFTDINILEMSNSVFMSLEKLMNYAKGNRNEF
jgi:uncharacterized protein (DUF302 family)